MPAGVKWWRSNRNQMTPRAITELPDYLSTVDEVDLIYITRIKASERPKIMGSRHAFEIFKNYFDPWKIDHHESFYFMVLSRANKVLGIKKLSEGGLTGTVCDIRFVFQAALLLNGCNIILCHNHPSGNLQPSDQDKMLTRKLVSAGQIMDVNVVDHLIITSDANQYYSFADEGCL